MMTAHDNPVTDSLSNQLEICIQTQFTGRLDVCDDNNQAWSLYFCVGRLVWAKGGSNGLRRWRRLLLEQCPQMQKQSTDLAEVKASQSQGYDLLLQWTKQQQMAGERAASMIRATVVEVLFDVLQQERTGQLSCASHAQDALDASLTLMNSRQALTQAQQDWAAWSNAGLSNLSPNIAPILRNADLLSQQTSPQVYQALTRVIDGDRSLRDVALMLKQDLLLFTRTLIAYVRKGMVEFVQVPDLSPPRLEKDLGRFERSAKPTAAPLVACIDDSPIEQRMMAQVLLQAGYRCIAIQDPVQALPMLLEKRPEFIFLDLVMPIANGYELCAQIRRISQFQEVPVVILTGNDGIIDRVRAKMVGSTDFISKPIAAEKVLAALKKYLPVLNDK
ncbi:MAG: response regulator [Aphanocapsa sp. GSE-SYN-MK-11-07L]|nr:response regulator [Aphanocapsa sp. GSE-SYN-MK-11-07L]